MAHAEESITISRPVNAVFDFVLDGTKNPLWRSTTMRSEVATLSNLRAYLESH